MIEQQGQVVAIDGGQARVRIGGTSGCPACDAGKGCGAGIFGRLLRRKPASISLENGLGARIGQRVVVGLPETIYLQLLGRLYALPLMGGLAGAAGGNYLSVRLGAVGGSADMVTLACAVLSAVLFAAWGRKRATEFPAEIVVHLLRINGDAGDGRCQGAVTADYT